MIVEVLHELVCDPRVFGDCWVQMEWNKVIEFPEWDRCDECLQIKNNGDKADIVYCDCQATLCSDCFAKHQKKGHGTYDEMMNDYYAAFEEEMRKNSEYSPTNGKGLSPEVSVSS